MHSKEAISWFLDDMMPHQQCIMSQYFRVSFVGESTVTWPDLRCQRGTMPFTTRCLSPNLQAPFCNPCPSVYPIYLSCPSILPILSVATELSKQTRDFQKKEINDRFTCTQCLGAFSRWVVASKARALGSAGNAPDLVWQNPGGDFWTKRNTNKSWKLGPQKQVNCNQKLGRIELALSNLHI